MKKTLQYSMLLVALAFNAGAAMPVVDAVAIATQKLNAQRDYFEQLLMAAQGEEELRRLMQQIVQIDESLKRLGDPALISKLAGSGVLADYLRRAELNLPTDKLLSDLSVGELLKFDPLLKGAGVGESVEVAGNVVAARDQEYYKPEAAAQRSLQQYQKTRSEVLARREVLKREIAANAEQTRVATTSSEVMKLGTIASSLHADLAAVDQELGFASMEVTHLAEANKIRAEVQRKAQVENERAALSTATKRDAATFRIPTQPVLFNR